MKRLSCLVIEDESLLAAVLADYIEQVPFLELASVFNDAISAMEYIESNPVDLAFIDINLPKLTGIEFIRMFQGRTKFIITTAYHEYALQGYELNVVDYLMKPIEFSRFLQAVKKVLGTGSGTQLSSVTPQVTQKNYLFVNINKKRVKINFSEILYIEGMKEYVKIFVSKEKWFITKIQIGQIQELLSEDFIRVHRSYIIARKKVTAYNLAEILLGTISIPVGSNYRSILPEQMEK